MDNSAKKPQKIRIWQRIAIFAAFFSLISGGVLLANWWKNQQINTKIQAKEQELAQLEQKQQTEQNQAWQEYQEQQKTKFRLLALANNPQIHQFFNDLLQGYAYRFARKQNLTDYCLPLSFGGFYQQKQETAQNFRELGTASFNLANQQTTIKLNQIFLFNKLGYERYFATPELYLNIDFAALIETISHEIAHYIQFVKYGKSSCESDYGTDKYIPWLTQEQQEFTEEIYQMIVNSVEYLTLEKYWKTINVSR